MKNLIFTPIRFFGLVLFLVSAYFLMVFILTDFVPRFGLASIIYFFLSIIFFTVELKFFRDQVLFEKGWINRLLMSSSKAIAFLCVLIGIYQSVVHVNWKIYEPLYITVPLLFGILIYFIDYLLFLNTAPRKTYKIFHTTTVLVFGVSSSLLLFQSNASTTIIFSEQNQNEAIIVFGIEGYPELPNTRFWQKTIEIPENGILITSSKIEDLPGHNRNYLSKEGNPIQLDAQFMTEVCIEQNTKIIALYFTKRAYYPYIPDGSTLPQKLYHKLRKSICNGHDNSSYHPTQSDLKKHKWLRKVRGF